MSTYAIGDIQGCFKTLLKLLKEINFDDAKDKIIFVGDLVNRGHNSLEVLRLIKQNPKSMQVILGNHDIFAIATFLKATQGLREHTMQALMAAKDAPELIDWLRKQALILKIDKKIFVHAGILPSVSIENALLHAEKISAKISGDQAKDFLTSFYSQKKARYLEDNNDDEKFIMSALNYMIYIRMCLDKNTMDLDYTGPLSEAPKDLFPWFKLRPDEEYQIYFGHWSAIGYLKYKNYFALDSGCVWGNKLTALRLEDERLIQVDNWEN